MEFKCCCPVAVSVELNGETLHTAHRATRFTPPQIRDLGALAVGKGTKTGTTLKTPRRAAQQCNALPAAAGRMECLPSGQRGQRLRAVPIVGSKADLPDLFRPGGRAYGGAQRSHRLGSTGALAPAFCAALAAPWWVKYAHLSAPAAWLADGRNGAGCPVEDTATVTTVLWAARARQDAERPSRRSASALPRSAPGHR